MAQTLTAVKIIQNSEKQRFFEILNKCEYRVLSGGYTSDNDPHMIEDSIIFIKGG